jgi:predicted component of type VI protein secretion system
MSVTLRLFRQDDPLQEIDRRVLAGGEMVIGRGQGADWVVSDPSCTLSRKHCLVALAGGAVTIRDDSTNGVALPDGTRPPPKTAVPVEAGGTIALGAFLIRVEVEGEETTGAAALTAPPEEETPAGRLLDAFCAGAQIDSSVFSAEDPVEVMRRLGGVYREMVQGLGRQVDERTRAKAGFGLEWTAVQAVDNNPFRWAPPQRVAVDLLVSPQEGFLGAEAAVRASFADVRDHQLRQAGASRAALEAALAALSPEAIAQGAAGRAPFKKKAEALWAEYVRAHTALLKEMGDGIGGRAFREAYGGDPLEPPAAD